MKQLSIISYLITALGLLCIAASAVADLDPMWTLVGALLTLAGVVKIAVVQLWRRVAHL